MLIKLMKNALFSILVLIFILFSNLFTFSMDQNTINFIVNSSKKAMLSPKLLTQTSDPIKTFYFYEKKYEIYLVEENVKTDGELLIMESNTGPEYMNYEIETTQTNSISHTLTENKSLNIELLKSLGFDFSASVNINNINIGANYEAPKITIGGQYAISTMTESGLVTSAKKNIKYNIPPYHKLKIFTQAIGKKYEMFEFTKQDDNWTVNEMYNITIYSVPHENVMVTPL